MTFRRRNNFTIIVTVAVLLVMVLVIPVTANPDVDFNGTPRSGVIPLTVTFSDNSTGKRNTHYAWEFGDGGIIYQPQIHHTNTILQESYSVTLTVTDERRTNSSHTIQLHHSQCTVSCTANCFVLSNVTSGTAPLTVGFTDASTGTAPLTMPGISPMTV